MELTPDDMQYWNCELFQIGLLELRKQRARKRLTATEMRIASLLAEGFHAKDIESELGKAQGTVKAYLSRIYKKTHIRDSRRDPFVQLGVYMNCELFRIGLSAA